MRHVMCPNLQALARDAGPDAFMFEVPAQGGLLEAVKQLADGPQAMPGIVNNSGGDSSSRVSEGCNEEHNSVSANTDIGCSGSAIASSNNSNNTNTPRTNTSMSDAAALPIQLISPGTSSMQGFAAAVLEEELAINLEVQATLQGHATFISALLLTVTQCDSCIMKAGMLAAVALWTSQYRNMERWVERCWEGGAL